MSEAVSRIVRVTPDKYGLDEIVVANADVHIERTSDKSVFICISYGEGKRHDLRVWLESSRVITASLENESDHPERTEA